RTRLQTPNTKHQAPEKLQARSAGRGLELGTWDFFGVWSLVFGVSIPGFLWRLEFEVWSCRAGRPSPKNGRCIKPVSCFSLAPRYVPDTHGLRYLTRRPPHP